MVRAFLLRVHELAPEARVAMSLRLAKPLAAAMHHTPPAGVHPELFLVCVAAAYQRRRGAAGRRLRSRRRRRRRRRHRRRRPRRRRERPLVAPTPSGPPDGPGGYAPPS